MQTKNPPLGFDRPVQLPTNPAERLEWQKANRSWWEQNPMRYDWRESIGATPQSREFFEEIDKRFFTDSKVYMPYQRVPFETLIDFDNLSNKDVLEIGVGCGSVAGLLVRHARSFVGIDLTEYATSTTTQRLRALGLIDKTWQVVRMDAESLQFNEASFDFIWSWGVIHHSSDTGQVLREMSRVLRPGGTAVTMVYHRGLWNYYVCHGLLWGVLTGTLFRTQSIHKTVQAHTDGAIARYFTADEWRSLASESFDVEKISICGSKSDVVPLPGGTNLKANAMRLFPDFLSRFLTNRLKMGTFLISRLRKKSN
jgi:ubiquinone/menaquinone biosynthesis C-methylase UbiE